MNKKIWIALAILIILLIGIGIFFYFKNQSSTPNENTYETDRTSINHSFNQMDKNNQQEDNFNTQEQQESSYDTNEDEENTEESEDNSTNIEEEQIASFSTKIYSNDSARQNNIAITCDTLNDTIIKNGSTFSFCNTVGASSTSKGYQKADIFDKNGNKKKGLGGR